MKTRGPEIVKGVLHVWYNRKTCDWDRQIEQAYLALDIERGKVAVICRPWPPAKKVIVGNG